MVPPDKKDREQKHRGTGRAAPLTATNATCTAPVPPTSPSIKARPSPMLVIVWSPDRERMGERFELTRKAPQVLGRTQPDFTGGPLRDRFMSSRHCELTLHQDKTLHVMDLDSKNGIFQNNQRERELNLKPGDLFQVGQSFLRYSWEVAYDWHTDGSRLSGISFAMQRVREGIQIAASHQRPALIIGPTGTGKEPTSQEIHRLSGRSGDMVTLNCATLPAEMVESELFGHAAGAFTGAKQAKKGLFEQANGGTLFLDEIATLPINLQPKLLRVLQESRFRPLGATREITVDVRAVAATNVDLLTMVRQETFRADLYARLCGSVITTPALNDRPDDLGALLDHFLTRHGHPDLEPSPELFWALWHHPWPLNVRELEQLVASAVASATDRVLELTPHIQEALNRQAKLGETTPGQERHTHAGKKGKAHQRGRTVPSAESLKAILKRHKGVVAYAAKELGIHRYQLYRWAKAANLDIDAMREEE